MVACHRTEASFSPVLVKDTNWRSGLPWTSVDGSADKQPSLVFFSQVSWSPKPRLPFQFSGADWNEQ